MHTVKRYSMRLPWATKRGAHLIQDQYIADISPLEGFSRESLDEALSELAANPSLHHIASPSLSFALQSIQDDIQNPISSLPSPHICPLFFLSETGELPTNLPLLKIKIKGLSPQAAYEKISKLPEGVKLRIDCNQSWSLEEALSFLNQLPQSQIDFIEEPTQSLEDLQVIARTCQYPLALDESLRAHPLESLKEIMDVAIIKPTLQLNYKGVIDRLRQWGKRCVLSSSFESVVGIDHIVKLATRMGVGEPLGIDTLKYTQGFSYDL